VVVVIVVVVAVAAVVVVLLWLLCFNACPASDAMLTAGIKRA